MKAAASLSMSESFQEWQRLSDAYIIGIEALAKTANPVLHSKQCASRANCKTAPELRITRPSALPLERDSVSRMDLQDHSD